MSGMNAVDFRTDPDVRARCSEGWAASGEDASPAASCPAMRGLGTAALIEGPVVRARCRLGSAKSPSGGSSPRVRGGTVIDRKAFPSIRTRRQLSSAKSRACDSLLPTALAAGAPMQLSGSSPGTSCRRLQASFVEAATAPATLVAAPAMALASLGTAAEAMPRSLGKERGSWCCSHGRSSPWRTSRQSAFKSTAAAAVPSDSDSGDRAGTCEFTPCLLSVACMASRRVLKPNRNSKSWKTSSKVPPAEASP
mmetsp:Transcript_22556/g.64025  ORF Transcript_22556/g.64025 Transcript_22556/m.64025 type:complete len:252 (+) Transcript_22556:400-1155(+)